MQVQEFKWSWRTFSINISLPDADVVAHGREGDRRDIIGWNWAIRLPPHFALRPIYMDSFDIVLLLTLLTLLKTRLATI